MIQGKEKDALKEAQQLFCLRELVVRSSLILGQNSGWVPLSVPKWEVHKKKIIKLNKAFYPLFSKQDAGFLKFRTTSLHSQL